MPIRLPLALAALAGLLASMSAMAGPDASTPSPPGVETVAADVDGEAEAGTGTEADSAPDADPGAATRAGGAPMPGAAVIAPLLEVQTEPPPKHAPWSIHSDPGTFALTTDSRSLSLHKPMLLLPATYSGRYPGEAMEVLFALSLKFRLHRKLPLYVAYSQKSFLQALNTENSKPFRDNNFNPEVFLRLKPKRPEQWAHLAFDLGAEHESNGQSLPLSRSWDRVYLAPYWQKGDTLVRWKWWWRVPEDSDRPADDPRRDDNPDIQDYLGWSELRIQRRLFQDRQQLSTLFRLNPNTGRGAVSLHYTIPGPGEGFFWTFYAFNGYGESLLDYDRSVTRVGLGISVAR